jgi:HK97 family phage major capsid protein
MSRDAIKAARLLKDQDQRYLWAPGLDGQTAGSILGYEIVEFQDMPVVAANNLVAAFGDLQQAYQIVDRIGIRVLRDPFTAKPFVKFYTTKRTGGGVKNFEAIKLLKVAVS